MNRTIIFVVVMQILGAVSLFDHFNQSGRLQPANLRSKALQRQANQQQDAKESAHGVEGSDIFCDYSRVEI